jgi:hypothetical protein
MFLNQFYTFGKYFWKKYDKTILLKKVWQNLFIFLEKVWQNLFIFLEKVWQNLYILFTPSHI